jgi:tetratricopeptide (TPR) repeat protein
VLRGEGRSGLWASRTAVAALVALLAMLGIVRPYGAAMACRSGEVAAADGESGLDDFRRAVRLAPHDEFCQLKVSDAAHAAARTAPAQERPALFEEARRAADEAVRLAPGSAAARASLAGVLTEMAAAGLASPDEALAEFDRAIAADPNNTTLLAEAGQSAVLLSRLGPAHDYFRRGLAVEPASGRLWAGLGTLALTVRDFDDAVTLLQRADAAEWHGDFPARLEARQSGALALLATGNLHQAEWSAAVVLRERPGSLKPHLIRARALELLNRRDEALAEYRAALALAPDDVPARNGVRRLEAPRPR